jgi:uncharacterized protein (DUF302 family)
MTISDHLVRYQEHVSAKPYEELVAAFEAAVAPVGNGEFAHAFAASESREEWEAACAGLFGPSGFMHVFSLDHGRLLGLYGVDAKAKMWIYGNPVIAASMLVHDTRVGGRVPLQILIYEGEDGAARIGYDLPSSIMSRFGDDEINQAAEKLDEKLVAFATELAGAQA